MELFYKSREISMNHLNQYWEKYQRAKFNLYLVHTYVLFSRRSQISYEEWEQREGKAKIALITLFSIVIFYLFKVSKFFLVILTCQELILEYGDSHPSLVLGLVVFNLSMFLYF